MDSSIFEFGLDVLIWTLTSTLDLKSLYDPFTFEFGQGPFMDPSIFEFGQGPYMDSFISEC